MTPNHAGHQRPNNHSHFPGNLGCRTSCASEGLSYKWGVVGGIRFIIFLQHTKAEDEVLETKWIICIFLGDQTEWLNELTVILLEQQQQWHSQNYPLQKNILRWWQLYTVWYALPKTTYGTLKVHHTSCRLCTETIPCTKTGTISVRLQGW